MGPHGLVADVKSQLRLIEIEQRAGDHPPLAPPPVRIDERGASRGRKAQQDRRLVDAPCAASVLDPGEQKARIVAERRRNRLDQRRAHRRARRRDAGLGKRRDVGAGEGRSARPSAEITAVEQTGGAICVVRPWRAKRRTRATSTLSVRASKLPSRHKARMICDASSERPSACAARAAAILPALDCGGSLGEKGGDIRRRVGMREEIGFLPLANPALGSASPDEPRESAASEAKDGRASARSEAHSSAVRSAGSLAAAASDARPAKSPFVYRTAAWELTRATPAAGPGWPRAPRWALKVRLGRPGSTRGDGALPEDPRPRCDAGSASLGFPREAGRERLASQRRRRTRHPG